MSAITNQDELRDMVSRSSKVDEENYQFYREHIDRLQEEEAGNIVAIVQGDLVATHQFTDDLDELRGFVNELKTEYGEDAVESAYITHIPDPDQALIL